MTDTLEEARRWFAEDLRIAAGIDTHPVIDAFARVPRETFIGPPPWRVGTRVHGAELLGYQTFAGDPRVLYHDVVVALDEEQEINNGQPSLWAKMLAAIDPRPGERILHLGCGTGYYSAILAEIVGEAGSVDAVEIDDALAGRARTALSAWPNVSVVLGDGSEVPQNFYDGIIVSAGLTHPLDCWLESLAPGGRLLFPLTMDGPQSRSGHGGMLLVSRAATHAFAARFLGPAGFIHFRGGRDPDANQKVVEAFRNRFRQMTNVRSLRRDEHAQDETCWLHGRRFCLSCREPE
ncbi:MAG TPA: methyltransferase domain-containing protein [Rhizomicrobium sp.]|jgi:protein-L-isoaspartate(D-aspartate) O-methyltransferase